MVAVYNSEEAANDLVMVSIDQKSFVSINEQNLVSITKYVSGRGDVDGGVKIELQNHQNIPVKLILSDSAPWYTEVHCNTLTFNRYDPGDQSSPIPLTPGLLLSMVKCRACVQVLILNPF